MTIHLPPHIENSIQAAVYSGRFKSVDDAMARAATLLLQELGQEQAQTEPPRVHRRRSRSELQADLGRRRRDSPGHPRGRMGQAAHRRGGATRPLPLRITQAANFMKKFFADAQYFVALINDKDQAHPAALAMGQALQGEPLITTKKR